MLGCSFILQTGTEHTEMRQSLHCRCPACKEIPTQ